MDLSTAPRLSSVYGGKGGGKPRKATRRYDLAFSPKTEKFRLSPRQWEALDLENNGFDFYDIDGRAILMLVSDSGETNPHMWDRRHKKETGEALGKTRNKVNRPMQELLTAKHPDVTKFSLKDIGTDEASGNRIFEVVPFVKDEAPATPVTEEATEIAAEAATETPTPVAVEESTEDADEAPEVTDEPVEAETEDDFAADIDDTPTVADPFEADDDF